MDWDDVWEIVLIVLSVIGMVGIIALFYKKYKVKRDRRRSGRTQVQSISTIQEMYVPAPQHNQSYLNSTAVGWNITSVDHNSQTVGVNTGFRDNGIQDLPQDPAFYGYPYEKPPPYNPNH